MTEEVSLREKRFVFKDRAEAGKLLARRLSGYKDTNSIVFAIPSGGVPVAAEIAKAHAFPLDVIIVDDGLASGYTMLSAVDFVKRHESQKIVIAVPTGAKRTVDSLLPQVYSSHNGFRINSEIKLSEYNCNQDLVSNPPGLSAVRTGKTENQIGFSIDELICLNVRSGLVFAVADAYENWYDIDDEEVISILNW